jgi:hypothetical protein
MQRRARSGACLAFKFAQLLNLWLWLSVCTKENIHFSIKKEAALCRAALSEYNQTYITCVFRHRGC